MDQTFAATSTPGPKKTELPFVEQVFVIAGAIR
jgi:hypothetical protein